MHPAGREQMKKFNLALKILMIFIVIVCCRKGKMPESYSEEIIKIEIPGVLHEQPKPGWDGPYVGRLFDLDSGQYEHLELGEVEIWIDVGLWQINLAVKSATVVGKSEPNYMTCLNLLSTRKNPRLRIENTPIPSDYICAETSEGKISFFRLESFVRVQKKPKFYDLFIELRYKTWEKKQNR